MIEPISETLTDLYMRQYIYWRRMRGLFLILAVAFGTAVGLHLLGLFSDGDEPSILTIVMTSCTTAIMMLAYIRADGNANEQADALRRLYHDAKHQEKNDAV